MPPGQKILPKVKRTAPGAFTFTPGPICLHPPARLSPQPHASLKHGRNVRVERHAYFTAPLPACSCYRTHAHGRTPPTPQATGRLCSLRESFHRLEASFLVEVDCGGVVVGHRELHTNMPLHGHGLHSCDEPPAVAATAPILVDRAGRAGYARLRTTTHGTARLRTAPHGTERHHSVVLDATYKCQLKLPAKASISGGYFFCNISSFNEGVQVRV